jgi:NAD(P)-dependent dehydrogenase (short-subunit alcohol dehydrogenase family)
MKLDPSVAAIVTGGASGLGEASARMLAGQGVKVAILDCRRSAGGPWRARSAACLRGERRRRSLGRRRAAEARAATGSSAFLVNCAGIAPGKRTVSKKRDTGEFVPHDLATFAARSR